MGLYVITFNCFSTFDFPVKGAQERPQVGIDGGSQVMPGGQDGNGGDAWGARYSPLGSSAGHTPDPSLSKLSQWDSKESKVPLIPCLETLQECENALASQFRRFLVIMLVFTRPIEIQLYS